MNRTRCPWCGKRIDKKKDTIKWSDAVASPSVPQMLRIANCGHCQHKYGQVVVFSYAWKLALAIILTVLLAFVLQSGLLLLLVIPLCFLNMLMPYSKLDDEGKVCETSTDLLCEMMIMEQYGKIKRDELYFLDDCFDNFEPFILASPIHIYSALKTNVILGEFLYMHEKNYNFIEKDSCVLYDSEMNPIAKIKFVIDTNTNL